MKVICVLYWTAFKEILTAREYSWDSSSGIMIQVLAYQESGNKLGWLKAANESWTRVVVYVALMALYILGGAKVNAVSSLHILRVDTGD